LKELLFHPHLRLPAHAFSTASSTRRRIGVVMTRSPSARGWRGSRRYVDGDSQLSAIGAA
jgi:hypothetical protein